MNEAPAEDVLDVAERVVRLVEVLDQLQAEDHSFIIEAVPARGLLRLLDEAHGRVHVERLARELRALEDLAGLEQGPLCGVAPRHGGPLCAAAPAPATAIRSVR